MHKGCPCKANSLGFSHTIILLEEGKVMACGDGKKGQLGLGMVFYHDKTKNGSNNIFQPINQHL